MFAATRHRRDKLVGLVKAYLGQVDPTSISKDEKDLLVLLNGWLDIRNEKSDKCTLLFDKICPVMKKLIDDGEKSPNRVILRSIWSERDMFPKLSQWIVGGDGEWQC